MDAAIIFSDILLPLEAMGMELLFDERGPVLPKPIRAREDVLALESVVDPREHLGYVGQALQRVAGGAASGNRIDRLLRGAPSRSPPTPSKAAPAVRSSSCGA